MHSASKVSSADLGGGQLVTKQACLRISLMQMYLNNIINIDILNVNPGNIMNFTFERF